MIDENAFGVLVSHYDLESTEYALEPGPFLEYLARFSAQIDAWFEAQPLAASLRRVELGHGVYLEFGDGEQLTNPLSWVRELRKRLVEADLPNVCLLAAGGRWLRDLDSAVPLDVEAPVPPAYGPSEPLRKTLAAEALAQPTTAGESAEAGWGPGLYVDQEAIEQLHLSLKNAPTALPVLSSVFFRIGS